MITMTSRLVLPIAAAAALGVSSASPPSVEQGLTLRKITVQSFGDGQRHNSTLYMTPSRVREASSNGSDFLLFLQRALFVTLDHQAKTYTEMSFEELERRVAEARSSMDEKEQGALEAMRGRLGEPGAEARIENLGDGGERLGYSTRHHRITLAPVVLEMWNAPELTVPDAYYDSLRLRALANPLFKLDLLYEALKKVEGVSLRSVLTIEAMGMKIQSSSEVTEVVRGPIPDLIFDIPESYSRQGIE